MPDDAYTSKIQREVGQTHETRIELYEELEEHLGLPVVSFYTSFSYPVMIRDGDAMMLEDMLQSLNLGNGFYLLINSPGGRALAAERIINICRSYSGTGDYRAIVPSKAKSAATMVCLGASELAVSDTSELGPVGPQIPNSEDGPVDRYSVRRLVQGYEELFDEAVETDGHLDPYLQQLQRYDDRDITELRSHLELAEEISVQSLSESMMADETIGDIRERIGVFLEPEETHRHGRPIYIEEMRDCGLTLDHYELDSDTWETVHELHMRLENFVSSNVSKCIESKTKSFATPVGDNDVEDE